jgi:hypothetical protein
MGWESQKAEIERLRAALQEISDLTAFYEPWAAIARKALGDKDA